VSPGDTVIVTMVSKVFRWQRGPVFQAKLVSMPRGAGDCYVIDVKGQLVHLNGNCSEFVGMQRDPVVHPGRERRE